MTVETRIDGASPSLCRVWSSGLPIHHGTDLPTATGAPQQQGARRANGDSTIGVEPRRPNRHEAVGHPPCAPTRLGVMARPCHYPRRVPMDRVVEPKPGSAGLARIGSDRQTSYPATLSGRLAGTRPVGAGRAVPASLPRNITRRPSQQTCR